jgi:large subunit ribosomal protein L6
MSRSGKMPITVPAGVDVKIEDGNLVTVKGKLGTLTQKLNPTIKLEMANGVINAVAPDDSREANALHGLTRTLVANMVEGVTNGFQKTLEINGVGYRAQLQGKNLLMNLGYSHPVEMEPADGITIEVPNPNTVIVKGIDKQVVGEFAAKVREKRLPEPYKGKGIKYSYEHIRRKEGKAGGKK